MPHREETSTGTADSDGERKQPSSAGPRQPGPRTQAPGCLVCAAPLHEAAAYYQVRVTGEMRLQQASRRPASHWPRQKRRRLPRRLV